MNLYGQKIDVKLLRQIVGRRVFIIEDSAQSHFASTCTNCEKNDHALCYKTEKSQRYADLSCYSFYPAKNLGAYGDGGIITTDNANLYKKSVFLKSWELLRKMCISMKD